jgi:hypothetical protein
MIFGRRAEEIWQQGAEQTHHVLCLAFVAGKKFVKASRGKFPERALSVGGMGGKHQPGVKRLHECTPAARDFGVFPGSLYHRSIARPEWGPQGRQPAGL